MGISCKGLRLFVTSLLLLPLLGLAVGCGKGGGSLSGKVTYKGETVQRGIVHFFPEGKGGDFSAPIKPDGTYSIANLPRGQVKIAVATGSSEPPDLSKRRGMGGGMAAKGMEKAKEKMGGPPPDKVAAGGSGGPSVPDSYADPDKSGLKVEVTGGKQAFDINIP